MAKPTPPPTPAPTALPTTTALAVPPAKTTSLPTPEPPSATPEPTATFWPTAMPEPTVTLSTETPTTSVATRTAPTVTPLAFQETTSPATTVPSLTPTLAATLAISPTVLLAETRAAAWPWPVLPGWVWPVAGGLGLFVVWLVVRFVAYTRQDLAMKRRMITEDAAARLAAHRRDIATRLEAPDAWWQVLSQIATDAANTPVRIPGDTLPQVNGDALAFTVLDHQDTRFTFTVTPERLRQPAYRVYTLDSPETQAEVSAVWHYLAAQWLQGTVPAVPRQATWALVVQTPPAPLRPKRARRWGWLGMVLCLPLILAFSTFVAAHLVQAQIATPTPVPTAAVTLSNTTGETVSVWTLVDEPVCVVCPDVPLPPGARRELTLTPGSVLWEVVAVPFGDFYTAYRVALVEAYVPPGAQAQDTVITLTAMPFSTGR